MFCSEVDDKAVGILFQGVGYLVAGVDEDGVLLDFYEGEVNARQTILNNCRNSFLVLDHTKFSRLAHVRGGHIKDVSKIFCDKEPPESILKLIESSSAELVICNE